jgi:nitroimidazol reductase NimA-like FMN-containing flavoprotein (pyridoxamine 5'-phosphate oxidase superfamily)
MSAIRELSHAECTQLLRRLEFGRLAVCTPQGPVIVPVNYVMDGDCVIVRTSSYSHVAAHARDLAAFEVDEIDPDMERGWSVVVVGQAEPLEDVDDLISSGLASSLSPWAPGARDMFIKITPSRVSGRHVSR